MMVTEQGLVASFCLILTAELSTLAIDSKHMRYMCRLDGNKTVRPWTDKNITGSCDAWTETTCCSNDDSHEIGSGQRVKFDQCGKQMSAKCRRHFERKLCFQYCSPYIGPWLLNRNGSRRFTKFRFVPLCRSQCEMWWEDCKDDMAFTEDWARGPDKWGWDACETIEQKYNDSTYFCEHAFGPFEFIVVSEEVPCMEIFGNLRNDRYVATMYSKEIELSGTDHLYGNALLYDEKADDTLPVDVTDKTWSKPKLFGLFFLLGAVLASLGYLTGFLLFPKCKTKLARSASRSSLIPNEEWHEEQA